MLACLNHRRLARLPKLMLLGSLAFAPACDTGTPVRMTAPSSSPATVLSPEFNSSFPGPGYDIGVTHYQCITDLSDDWDSDGLNDKCENALALAFDPRIRVHINNGEDSSREPVYAVMKNSSGASVRIAYLLAYHRDVGSDYDFTPFDPPVGWAPHSGDSEFIIANVVESGGAWLLQSIYTSAHWGAGKVCKLWIPGCYTTDYSVWTGYANLSYADNDRGRPKIWSSWGKHANYVSFDACNDHPFDSCYFTDTWTEDLLVYKGSERNIGSSSHPLIDCTGSKSTYYPGIECFWSDADDVFDGWYSDGWGVKRAYSYDKVLRYFGFMGVPPSSMPTISEVHGLTEVAEYANCYWNVSVSGGTTPYTYKWYKNDTLVSTSNGYGTNTGAESFMLNVVVQDAYGFTGTHSVVIEVAPGHPYCDE
jgi:hypothetical protein